MNAVTSAGDIATSSRPSLASRSLASGSLSALIKASFALRTMPVGVPTGATNTCQPEAAKPGMVSATVGRSGKSAKRLGDATASGLTVPA